MLSNLPNFSLPPQPGSGCDGLKVAPKRLPMLNPQNPRMWPYLEKALSRRD